MARIPVAVAESSSSRWLITLGYSLLYRGKVGEIYKVPAKPQQLLMLRSDRLSIFDIVLPCLVPQKGEVLIALTHYWLTQVFPDVPNHLLAWGRNRKLWETAGWSEESIHQLPLKSLLLIERGETWPYEMIFRAHLGGSVWQEYEQSGTACGQPLPAGLKKWQKLPDGPVFTPTTKAESGHDIKVTLEDYLAATGERGRALMERDRQVYERAYEHAAGRGILILDTKFENDRSSGMLIDEVLTPDSSRFTTPEDLAAAITEGRDPIFYDKEPVRVWGRLVPTSWGKGLHRLDPENKEHLDFIKGLVIPNSIIAETQRRYLDIFERLTGMSLLKYQETVMDVFGRGD